MGNYSTKLSILIIIFLSISLASCRKEGGEVVGQSKQDFTPEEIAMVGEQISQAIEDNPVTFDIIDRTQMEPGYQYVEQLFHTLVNTAPVLNRLNFDWKIQILENDSLRTAFIGPGGHFYIYTGMLKYLESETELLSVIGHEIYYADRGGVEKAIISEFGGDSFGDLILGQPVSSINDIALYLNDVSYPEETIFSADSFSVELICPFLYDPLGLHHIIEKHIENPDVEVAWLERLDVSDNQDRLDRIFEQASTCDNFGKDYKDRYEQFKAMLP